MTHRLQLKKSRKKIPIFGCALINHFVMAWWLCCCIDTCKQRLRFLKAMGILRCLVRVTANSNNLFSEGLPADHTGLVASCIFDPRSQEALEEVGQCWLHHCRGEILTGQMKMSWFGWLHLRRSSGHVMNHTNIQQDKILLTPHFSLK